MAGVITHQQRAVLEAIEALERLESALQGLSSATTGDLDGRVDSLIQELKALVGKAAAGRNDAVSSYDEATGEKRAESATRAEGQSDRLCVSRN
jgi:hypothetical protein